MQGIEIHTLNGALVVFRRLMLVSVALGVAGALPAQVPQSEYAARRAALAARMQDGVLLVLGAREPAEDFLSFYQSPDFYYLTGFKEPDAVLLIAKHGESVTPIMFVQPHEPAREVWTGHRAGPELVSQETGMAAQPLNRFRSVLDSVLGTTSQLYMVGNFDDGEIRSPDQQFVDAIKKAHQNLSITNLTGAVRGQRGHKSAAELALLRKSIDITVAAQREAIRAVQPGMNEFEIQALIEYTFRRNGADRPSFSTIVGSGPNSTTLHYNTDDRFMNAGEVVVMDIGASYRGYAADVTRTVPVSGTFSPEQRDIYQLVRDAQAAGERQTTLGAMMDSADATLAHGLTKLGLIEAPNAQFDCGQGGQCSQMRLYYMHGLGHGIGLEVHDPDQYQNNGPLKLGSAFTIEPGIYVRASLLDEIPDTPRNRDMIAKIRAAFEKYKNIGVRIEDDYIVTDKGVEWVSRAPREISEIEALMKTHVTPAGRNAQTVNWYKETTEQ